jgi:DNA repair protein RadA/Sms
MNKKFKTVYVCSQCGQDFTKWRGKCDNCGAWDTVTEYRQAAVSQRTANTRTPSKVVSVADYQSSPVKRTSSRFVEVDRVLGGGLVNGALVLVGGDPGIGKSTLLLQLLGQWASAKKVLYVSGEESAEQVSMRASRLGIGNAPVHILTETSMEAVIGILEENKPDIVVIDSIQTMFSESLESAPGSVSQVRESAAMLLRFAKESNASVFLVGHVTKDGAIAGPRLLEHIVDTVLYFEGDSSYNYRILRAVKNRFGPSGEIALFSMSDTGLRELTNASEFFIMNREHPQIGTAIAPIIEGSRVLVVELQALVNRSHFGLPQRVASGINPRKLSLLLAVLERHGDIQLGDHDIFFNIAGGLVVSEPAIDLGIAAAVMSSFRNKPLRSDLAFIGEIGLGGEIRPVNSMIPRFKELARMGFKECVVTKPRGKIDWNGDYGIKLVHCESVSLLQDLLF